jgi:1-acyl-sn-glycerol-3-phosphate acyltransferase
MKLSTRITIIAVVLWVAGAAIFALDLLPTIFGIVVISFFRPLVFEKILDREKENER